MTYRTFFNRNDDRLNKQKASGIPTHSAKGRTRNLGAIVIGPGICSGLSDKNCNQAN